MTRPTIPAPSTVSVGLVGGPRLDLTFGSVSLHISRLDSGTVEVDTPNTSITIDEPGDYRIDVDRNGRTCALVSRGTVYITSVRGELPLTAGRFINGMTAPMKFAAQRDQIKAMMLQTPQHVAVSEMEGLLAMIG